MNSAAGFLRVAMLSVEQSVKWL